MQVLAGDPLTGLINTLGIGQCLTLITSWVNAIKKPICFNPAFQKGRNQGALIMTHQNKTSSGLI